MKQITTGLVDENGNQSQPRTYQRRRHRHGTVSQAAGSQQGLDHFGFEVEDVKEVVDRINQKYPELLHTKALSYVPFAGIERKIPPELNSIFHKKGSPMSERDI